MSHPNNTKWLEEASDNFAEALEKRDFAQAEAVIGDMREYGFDTEDFVKELQAARNGHDI